MCILTPCSACATVKCRSIFSPLTGHLPLYPASGVMLGSPVVLQVVSVLHWSRKCAKAVNSEHIGFFAGVSHHNVWTQYFQVFKYPSLRCTEAAVFGRPVAWGGRIVVTDRHTNTQTKYSNPRCTCAPRVNKQVHSHGSCDIQEQVMAHTMSEVWVFGHCYTSYMTCMYIYAWSCPCTWRTLLSRLQLVNDTSQNAIQCAV